MTNHRRAFMKSLAGVAPLVYLTGCGGSIKTAMLPKTSWPTPLGGSPRGTIVTPVTPSFHPDAGSSAVNPLPRSAWTTIGPKLYNINPMNRVTRITIHHEGSPALVNFTDRASTAQRLRQDLNYHQHSNGWADIGYHFIVDRAGTVWEGRSLRYQGAHVKDNNEHNIGLMVLGNFNEQYPSQEQLNATQRSVRDLRRKYHVNLGAIFTHREIGATSCPGAHLQPRIDQMRSRGAFT